VGLYASSFPLAAPTCTLWVLRYSALALLFVLDLNLLSVDRGRSMIAFCSFGVGEMV
jgi:hypothetical protein